MNIVLQISNNWEMVTNSLQKKSLFKYSIIYIGVMILFLSCNSAKINDGKIVYPQKETITYKSVINIADKLEKNFPNSTFMLELREAKLYSLGDYYILQTIFCGPSGRASNYEHYLLFDKNYSKIFDFHSLSDNIQNVWMVNDTIFIDLLDYNIDDYYDGVYFEDDVDTFNFSLNHTKLSTATFSYDTISIEKVFLTFKDAYNYNVPVNLNSSR